VVQSSDDVQPPSDDVLSEAGGDSADDTAPADDAMPGDDSNPLPSDLENDLSDDGAFADGEINTDTLPPGLTDSLVLLLHMEESSWDGVANEVLDSSGLANHGVSFGTATTTSGGKFGRGGLFDGSGWAIVADSPSLRPTSAMTMSAWIYPTNIGSGYPGIIAKRVSYGIDEAYDMYIDPNGRIYVDVQSLDDRFPTNTVFQNNLWYHVAVVFDGTLPADQRVHVYVNGVLDTTASESSTTIQPYTSDLYIGTLPNGGNSFVGTIDEVAIWTRALSETEIVGLASATGPM